MYEYKTIIYIDASNVYKNVGRIDYVRLMRYLTNRFGERNRKFIEVKVFIPVLENEINIKNNFREFLKGIGYEVHLTDVFRTADGVRRKDNTDIQIAVEMTNDIRRDAVKEIVLISGDRDFLFILEKAIHAGKEVSIIGPENATCHEYKIMRNYKRIEEIYGIQNLEGNVYSKEMEQVLS